MHEERDNYKTKIVQPKHHKSDHTAYPFTMAAASALRYQMHIFLSWPGRLVSMVSRHVTRRKCGLYTNYPIRTEGVEIDTEGRHREGERDRHLNGARGAWQRHRSLGSCRTPRFLAARSAKLLCSASGSYLPGSSCALQRWPLKRGLARPAGLDPRFANGGDRADHVERARKRTSNGSPLRRP